MKPTRAPILLAPNAPAPKRNAAKQKTLI